MAGLNIRASDVTYLNVGTSFVQGRVEGLSALASGTLRINRAGKRLEWVARQGGVTYLMSAQGVDAGATARATGSVWILGGRDLLYFALDGRAYLVRQRPYESVTAERLVNLVDSNDFGSSSASFSFLSGGADLVVPAGKVLRVTSLSVAMSTFNYQGSFYSYSWVLRGTGIGSTSTAAYWEMGTPDAPLVILPPGTPLIDFSFNNIKGTNDHRIRIEGVLADS